MLFTTTLIVIRKGGCAYVQPPFLTFVTNLKSKKLHLSSQSDYKIQVSEKTGYYMMCIVTNQFSIGR